ncbi:MAG: helix-turn-helix domain-containing protein [Pseudomonadota bacterium]|nr:helix-turn-helix domain-containing protein [Pseudomonadota bacterium]
MQPDQRLRQIQQARQAVLSDGAPAAALADRAWVEQSWRRCLARGQRPEAEVQFNPVPRGAGRRAQEAHHGLLTAAAPELQRLARTVAPIGYFALLTDAAGCVLDVAGAIDAGDRHASAIARVGVDLSEPGIGTSAIGAALSEQRPVWLHRGEHFFEQTSVYSCAGAPLLGPTGECVGMIDLTGIHAAERPELQHLLARSARAVEDALLRASAHALCLRLAWPHAPSGEGARALVCLDEGGTITGCNTPARLMLPGLRALAHGPLHASDVFALPWASLFDLARQHAAALVPLCSGLHVQARAHRSDSATQPLLKTLQAGLIQQTLRQSGGNVSEAARLLGVSRATLYRRLAGSRSAPPARDA